MSYILIADDEDAICQLFVELLTDAGYRVADAGDGRAALAVLRQPGPPPCVAFIDHMMPNMDGLELRRQMLADPQLANIPVILLSADPRVQAQAAALQADFLAKPFGAQDVLTLAQHYCGQHI